MISSRSRTSAWTSAHKAIDDRLTLHLSKRLSRRHLELCSSRRARRTRKTTGWPAAVTATAHTLSHIERRIGWRWGRKEELIVLTDRYSIARM